MPNHDSGPIHPPAVTRRWRKPAVIAGIVAVLGFITSEMLLRSLYGLGDPPVMLGDPAMEYRHAPNGHYMRRGNAMTINRYSMRSDDFPEKKSEAGERRVLFIGDSVINGGANTDQSELATTLLQQQLRASLGRVVFVGNISAGSWGPQNQLAYVERFGLFEADVVVIVISSHDATDEIGPLPTTEAVTSKSYLLAWQEVADRLLGQTITEPAIEKGRAEPCLAAFDTMLTRITDSGANVIVAFHYQTHELEEDAESPGHAMLRDVCKRHNIEPILLKPAYLNARAAGINPFRDAIHLNPQGQRVLADTLRPLIENALTTPATPTTQP